MTTRPDRIPSAAVDHFAAGLPRPDTFWDLVVRRAELSGERTMLVDEHDRHLTFAGFRDRAERVAAALAAYGVGPGSKVVWQLPTRIGSALVIAALARLGAVQAALIPQYGVREATAAITAARPDLLIVPGVWHGRDYGAEAAALPGRPRVLVVGDEAPEADPAGVLPPEPSAGTEPRWIHFTSGSSGIPKGVLNTEASLLAAAHGFTLHGRLGERPDEFGCLAVPVAHVGGVTYLMTLLLGGFPALFLEAFNPRAAAGHFRRHRVTFSGGSTSFYTALVDEQRRSGADPLFPDLRLLKGGGAPCPPSVFRAVRDELGAVLAHDYGMTEVPMICVASPHATEEQLAHTDGAPIPGVTVRIVDGERLLPTDVEGEIQVRGASVCAGYLEPAHTAEAFTPDGWFRTGDRGRVRADGLVEVTGRSKDLIIRKGEKIAPVELETLLVNHPAVGEAAVIGLPDEVRGELVCAVVTLRQEVVRPALADLVGHLRAAGVMTQKLPERLEIVDELPRTGLGKVHKAALYRRFTASATGA
ncbi:AMP-binding protein [Streptomyces sp. NPDC055092]